MSDAKVGLVKVAMIRDSETPIGYPGTLYLKCPCGARPKTDTETDVACKCGQTYSGNGWLREREAAKQDSEWALGGGETEARR